MTTTSIPVRAAREGALLRLRALPQVGAAALGLAVLASVAAADGGYFPTAWGWTSLALLWAAGLAVAMRRDIRVDTPGIVFVAALLALAGWVALSTAWSSASTQTFLEVERGLVYVAGAAAALLIVRRRSVGALLGGALGGIAIVSAYALATRLFPGRFAFDPFAGYRLAEPLGYWNALGIFAVVGIVLALGFAARATSVAGRALAAASLPILVLTLYFTFGRGPWVALGVALAAGILLDARRLQLAVAIVVLAIPTGLAVWLASTSDALTNQRAAVTEASAQGHRLAVAVVLLGALSAALAVVVAAIERRVIVPRLLRLAWAAVLVVLVVSVLAGVFARFGSPPTLVRKAHDAFTAPAPKVDGNLNERLFSLSGNSRAKYWEVAWDNYAAHAWLGSGAGTFDRVWKQNRPTAIPGRDAHSLYVETLTELGPIGLAFLLVALGAPLVAAAKARRHPLVPAAFGAYVAYLVHAGVDWDWEIPAVTLAALFCGGALLLAARRETAQAISPGVRIGTLAAIVALSAFAFIGLIGNSALAASNDALAEGQWSEAESQARKATRWAPWSSQPWEYLADAQIGQGDPQAARANLLKAISKDEGNWKLWLNLAFVSMGSERRQALARAQALNPLSPEIAALRPLLSGPQEVAP